MEILRVITRNCQEYQEVQIDGLSALRINRQWFPELNDIAYEPYRVFLQVLLNTFYGAVLFGTLMTDDILDDFIADHQAQDLFQPALMGVFEDKFEIVRPFTISYSKNDSMVIQPYFCRDVTLLFNDCRIEIDEAWQLIFDSIKYQSIALFLSKGKVDASLLGSWLGERAHSKEFVSQVLTVYDYIVVSRVDGFYLTVFTKPDADLEVFRRAVENTSEYVATLPWFISLKDHLRWDYYYGCWSLKPKEDAACDTGIQGAAGSITDTRVERPFNKWPETDGDAASLVASNLLRLESVVARRHYKSTLYGLNILRQNMNGDRLFSSDCYEPYRVFFKALFEELRGVALFSGDLALDWLMRTVADLQSQAVFHPTELSVESDSFRYGRYQPRLSPHELRVNPTAVLCNRFTELYCSEGEAPAEASIMLNRGICEDAAALFLTPRTAPEPRAENLLNAVFPGLKSDKFIDFALNIYDYIVVFQSDGRNISIIAQVGTDLGVVERAACRATDYIKSTAWFASNSDDIHWSELYGCWVTR
jgi:hypothetical protein